MATPIYLVSKYVHVCATSDAAILLDLRADRYHGLNRKQSHMLASLVQGWPHPVDIGEVDKDAAAEFADGLVEQGLLTLDGMRGKSAAPAGIQRAQFELHKWQAEDWKTIRVTHFFRFAFACARALISFKLRSIESVVRKVEHRKICATARNRGTENLVMMREATRVFQALRPLFYTEKNYCLFDSLVLVEFMASYDLFPTWVIGVRSVPFGAHSWIQIEHYVLSCPVRRTSEYIPILAV